MTVGIVCGFEFGTLSTSGGGLFGVVNGALTIQSTTKRTGTYALKVDSDFDYVQIGSKATSTFQSTNRFYFRYASLPSADVEIFRLGGANPIGIKIDTSGRIYPYFDTTNGTDKSAILAADTWHRIDFKVENYDTHTIDVQVNGTAIPQLSVSSSGWTVGGLHIGTITGTATGLEFYFDDIIQSNTTSDYPFGAGSVIGLSPSSDGTHNAGTNIIEAQDGTDIGVTTAYDKVNSVPIGDTTTYVIQSAAGSGNYAEVNFPDTTETIIHGAKAYLGYYCGSSVANNGACYIVDEDSTQTELWGTPSALQDYSETSLFYKSGILPTPTGGWDQAAVNALKCRMGNCTDASPSGPRFVDVFIEVAVGEASGTSTSSSKAAYLSGQGNEASNKAAFLAGSLDATPSSKAAYLAGMTSTDVNSSKAAFLAGIADATPSSKAAYLSGQGSETSSKPAFLQGAADATPSSKAAYLNGVAGADSSKAAYLEGYVAETTVGPNYPSTNTFDEAVTPYDDIGWTNHDNVISDNSVYATITAPTFDNGVISYRINANGFGFSIPSNAVILGISVEVERRYATATVKDALMALRNPITATTSENKADTVNNWPSTDTVKSYGGTADLWGIEWSPEAINSASFAAYFAAVATGDNADAYVDFIRVSVTYKEGTNVTTSKAAFLAGGADATPSSLPAFLAGGEVVTGSQAAYLSGVAEGTTVTSSKPAYLKGESSFTGAKSAFLAGSASATPSSKAAYLAGANGIVGSKPAYLSGTAPTGTSSKAAYLEGILPTGTSSKAAYLSGKYLLGKAFGEETPLLMEDAVSWQTWSDGAGSVPTVTGDTDWGQLTLAPDGEEARSAVYDTGNTNAKTITISRNRYGTGQGIYTTQIRGAATTFTQDASTPAWETYTAPVEKTWRYVQVRVTNL